MGDSPLETVFIVSEWYCWAFIALNYGRGWACVMCRGWILGEKGFSFSFFLLMLICNELKIR